MRQTIAYIYGAGHCGSTLLNLLLNGHSDMLGLSELHHLGEYARSGHAALDDPFWREVGPCFERKTGQMLADVSLRAPYQSYRKVLRARKTDLEPWGRTQEALFECLGRQSDADVLVDASKRWQRLYLLWRTGRFHLKMIHLVRDGRAVLNSYVRKYDRFGKGFRRWMKSMLYGTFLKHVVFERANRLRVRYEDLATQPERELRRICAFLGRVYQPKMLDYREGQYVGIGGNRMRRRSDERIELDEKWKRELPRRHRAKFALLGGWLNRCYGY